MTATVLATLLALVSTLAILLVIGRRVVRLVRARRARTIDIRQERLRIRREEHAAEELLRASTSRALAEMLHAARSSPREAGHWRQR